MNASVIIGDVFRWILATALMIFVINFSFVGAFYVFEFILKWVIDFNTLAYLLLFSVALSIGTMLILIIVPTVVYLIMLLVRQKKWFGNVFGTIYLISILALLIMFWTSYFTFGWEQATRHHFLNNWFYSFFLFGLFGIPLKISENYVAYTQKQELA